MIARLVLLVLTSLFVFVSAYASASETYEKGDVIQLAQADDSKKDKKGKKKPGDNEDEEPDCE